MLHDIYPGDCCIAMAASNKQSKNNKISIDVWVILVAVAITLALWGLLIRMVYTSYLISNPHVTSPSSIMGANQVQKLLDETTALLRDIKKLNMLNSSHPALRSPETSIGDAIAALELKQRQIVLVETDLLELQSELGNTERKYAECIDETYGLKLTLDECKSSLSESAILHPHNLTSHITVPPLVEQKPVVSQDSSDAPWLVIGIPTVGRAHNEDYLLRTLQTMAAQLPDFEDDMFYKKISIVLLNIQGSEHRRFQEAKEMYTHPDNPKSGYFRFETLQPGEETADPKTGATPANDPGNANVPGYRVRKQTRSIAAVMQKAVDKIPKARYFMFLEDDMEFCPSGFLAIHYLLNKASRYHPDWLAIRASYGMNGIFLHYKDMNPFREYLLRHQLRRPPDHLVVEWFAGESPESAAHKGQRAHIGFRYNIFNHIGVVSSLRSQKQTTFPVCYDGLYEPTVFKVEAFSPRECPRDDIWPCHHIHGAPDPTRIHWESLRP